MVTILPTLIVAYKQHLVHNCPHPLLLPGFGTHASEIFSQFTDFELNFCAFNPWTC